MARYDLTDFEWSVVQPLLPNKPRGVPRALDVARLDQSKGSLTTRLKRDGRNDEFMLKLLSRM